MHDNHEPACSLCTKFVLPFGAESPLADWGYCESSGYRPTEQELRDIEEQVRRGDYRFLKEKKIQLYEGFGEGCDRFEDAGHHH